MLRDFCHLGERRFHDQQGYLLLDLIVGSTILSLTVTALGGAFVAAFYAARLSSDMLTADCLVQEKIEQLRSSVLSTEPGDSVETIVLNHTKFERRTTVTHHNYYRSLWVVHITIQWPQPRSIGQVTYCTYLFSQLELGSAQP